jgi:hypothetical protein
MSRHFGGPKSWICRWIRGVDLLVDLGRLAGRTRRKNRTRQAHIRSPRPWYDSNAIRELRRAFRWLLNQYRVSLCHASLRLRPRLFDKDIGPVHLDDEAKVVGYQKANAQPVLGIHARGRYYALSIIPLQPEPLPRAFWAAATLS